MSLIERLIIALILLSLVCVVPGLLTLLAVVTVLFRPKLVLKAVQSLYE